MIDSARGEIPTQEMTRRKKLVCVKLVFWRNSNNEIIQCPLLPLVVRGLINADSWTFRASNPVAFYIQDASKWEEECNKGINVWMKVPIERPDRKVGRQTVIFGFMIGSRAPFTNSNDSPFTAICWTLIQLSLKRYYVCKNLFLSNTFCQSTRAMKPYEFCCFPFYQLRIVE